MKFYFIHGRGSPVWPPAGSEKIFEFLRGGVAGSLYQESGIPLHAYGELRSTCRRLGQGAVRGMYLSNAASTDPVMRKLGLYGIW
jgi:hypothetical protein